MPVGPSGQRNAKVATLGDLPVAVWEEDGSDGNGIILASTLDASGQPSPPVRVSPFGTDARRPSLTAGEGELMVTWVESNGDRTWRIYSEHIDGGGHPISAARKVADRVSSTYTSSAFGAGVWLVLWEESGGALINGDNVSPVSVGGYRPKAIFDGRTFLVTSIHLQYFGGHAPIFNAAVLGERLAPDGSRSAVGGMGGESSAFAYFSLIPFLAIGNDAVFTAWQTSRRTELKLFDALRFPEPKAVVRLRHRAAHDPGKPYPSFGTPVVVSADAASFRLISNDQGVLRDSTFDRTNADLLDAQVLGTVDATVDDAALTTRGPVFVIESNATNSRLAWLLVR